MSAQFNSVQYNSIHYYNYKDYFFDFFRKAEYNKSIV